MFGKKLLSVTFCILCLVNATGVFAQDKGADFTGLWQGIDNVDGSLRTLSFVALGSDGIWEVRGHDTFWTLCDGPGGLEDTKGKVENGVLHTKGTLACANGKKVPMETRYEPQGSVDKGVVVERVVGKAFRTVLFRISQ